MFSFYQRIQECKSLDSHIKAKDNIILVDDGAATGATVIAAARWIRRNYNSKRLIICVPVVPKQTRDLLKKESDYVETIAVPSDNEIKKEAKLRDYSLNALMNTILTKHVDFYRHATDLGCVIWSPGVFLSFLDLMDENATC